MKIKCENCDNDVLSDYLKHNRVYVEGKHYPVLWCNNCRDSYSSTCSECLNCMNGPLVDTLTHLCNGCTIKCECGDSVPFRYMYSIDKEYMCSTCYEDKYINCKSCDFEFSNEELNQNGICKMCAEG